MTKKDYAKFANMLKRVRRGYQDNGNPVEQRAIDHVIREIVYIFQVDNPRFNSARFNQAIKGA